MVSGIQRCDSAQCGIVTLDDGTRLYVSYSTVIGIDAPDGRAKFTDQKYSVTTTKQRNTKLMRAAGHGRCDIIPHDEFVALCAPHGLRESSYRGVRSPHSF